MSNNGQFVFRNALTGLVTARLRIQKPNLDEQDVRFTRILANLEQSMEYWLAVEEFELKQQPPGSEEWPT